MGSHAGDDRGSSLGVKPGALTDLLRQVAAAPGKQGGDPPRLDPGTVVGRFEILRELGRGGFGTVYEARDRELGRQVALKLVRPGSAAEEGRVPREAEAIARLDHPNLITLYDVGRCEQGPYLVFELLRGKTLQERLDDGPMPVQEAVHIAVEVARGLAYAHAEGVVHRDLKPSNVFVTNKGRVKILDFGMAHAFGRRGLSGGTPAYMAPEQWEDDPEDERTDVFALGVMLHRMLSGGYPFPEGGGRWAAEAVAAARLEVPGAPALGGLVGRMLERPPKGRPRDGAAALAALLPIEEVLRASPAADGLAGAADLAARGVRGPPTPDSAAGGPSIRARSRAWLIGAMLLAAVVLAGGGVLLLRRFGPPASQGKGPVAVAVADVTNETGDPELDALSGILITSLEQSRGLRVVTRKRMLDVLRLAGKEVPARIDEGLALEVARRERVHDLLLPVVRRLGARYVVDLRGVDPVDGRVRFSTRETAEAKPGLLPVVDRLADRTLAELRDGGVQPGFGHARAPTPVAAAITGSMEAYHHYFLGQQRYDELRVVDALAEYQKALAIDPGFALAHHGIAICMGVLNAPDADRRAHADAAAAAADRLPVKEALLVRAFRARSYLRIPEARALYAQAAERYPQDTEVLLWAVNLEINNFGDAGRALALAQAALRLDPSSRRARSYAVIALIRLDRSDEGATHATEWEADGKSPLISCRLAEAEVARRDLDRALAAARRCAAASRGLAPGIGSRELFLVHLLREELDQAAATTATMREAGQEKEAAWLAARLAAFRGRQREAEQLGRRAWRISSPADNDLVIILAARGDSAELRQAVQEIRARTHSWDRTLAAHLAVAGVAEPALARDSAWTEPWPAGLLEAMERRSTGDLPGARALLAPIAANAASAHRVAAAYALTETCHLAGDARCVLEAAETVRLSILSPLDYGVMCAWAWPRALYWSAVAHQRLGETDRARAKAERLLRLWREADPDLPHLREARALCAELRCRP